MTHSAMRSEFEQLIDVYAPVSQLGTGFTFTEGPVWHPTEHYLLFSDMPADVRRRWDQRGGVRGHARAGDTAEAAGAASRLTLRRHLAMAVAMPRSMEHRRRTMLRRARIRRAMVHRP